MEFRNWRRRGYWSPFLLYFTAVGIENNTAGDALGPRIDGCDVSFFEPLILNLTRKLREICNRNIHNTNNHLLIVYVCVSLFID
jgi:hypothetical protein